MHLNRVFLASRVTRTYLSFLIYKLEGTMPTFPGHDETNELLSLGG